MSRHTRIPAPRTVLTAAAALLLGAPAGVVAGCAADARPTVLSSSNASPGFPTIPSAERVRATVTFDPEHARALGSDVLNQDLLPLRIHLAASGTEALSLSANTLEARLYLQDGTVLGLAPRARIPAAAQRRALPLTALPAGGAPLAGFLFFDLGGELKVREHYALADAGAVYREIDLEKSLLAFRVDTPDGPREVRVGVRPQRPRSEESR